MKMASTLSDDPAPSASLDHLEAQAAPMQPRAQPEPLGGLPWPQEPGSGRPNDEDLAPSTTRRADAAAAALGRRTAGWKVGGPQMTRVCNCTPRALLAEARARHGAALLYLHRAQVAGVVAARASRCGGRCDCCSGLSASHKPSALRAFGAP